MTMKRHLIALFALFALGTFALASALPQNGTVVVNNDSGAQVGTGTIVNGSLTLTLDAGTTGLVTFTVTASSGETESYQAMVDSNGKVTVVHDGTMQDLNSYAKDSGVDSVDVSEAPEASSSSDASATEDSSSSSTEAETPDSNGSSASGDSSSSSQTESTGEDSVKVGTSVGSTVTGGSDTSVKTSSDD